MRPVALLAQGSGRSRALARAHDLPLFSAVSELPAGIDLALAALPASADGVVLDLLERGVPALCEHPRSPAFVQKALETAERTGASFQINGHFGDLPAARSFAETCRAQRTASTPRFVQITAQERSLYAVLDVLDRAWGGVEGLELEAAPASDKPLPWKSDVGGWIRLVGRLDEIPVDFRIQVPPASPPDGSPAYSVDLQLAVGFDAGVLSLLSLAGPVVWNRNLARAAAGDQALWEMLGGSGHSIHGPSPLELRRAREDANRRVIGRLLRVLEGAEPDAVVSRQRLLGLAQAWELVGTQLRA